MSTIRKKKLSKKRSPGEDYESIKQLIISSENAKFEYKQQNRSRPFSTASKAKIRKLFLYIFNDESCEYSAVYFSQRGRYARKLEFTEIEKCQQRSQKYIYNTCFQTQIEIFQTT